MNVKTTFRSFQYAVLLLSLGLVFLFSSNSSQAADTSSADFEQANKCYEQGKYGEAVSHYDKLLQRGEASEAIYFNLGNAYFKLNQFGHAIASYRQAEQLAPRDPELRANLQFARAQARGGSPQSGERRHLFLNYLTLNEWTWLTVIALWFLFLLLAWMQWRPDIRPKLRNPALVSGLAFVLLGICLAVAFNEDYLTKTAIVITGEADVHNGPLDESQAAYKVRDGAELIVLDQKDGWYQVSDQSQRVGWLRQDQVLIFSPRAQQKSKVV
ncbi:tetratricopeptide repeat protein [Pedosphaera parvula]|nr:tetratricopeptide repeat protein [Pedosphaera parvula]